MPPSRPTRVSDEDLVGTSRVRHLEKRVCGLERLFRRKTMGNKILKGGRPSASNLDIAQPKKNIAFTVPERSDGWFAATRSLDVARSPVNERRGRTATPRGPNCKAGDAALLPTIRTIVDARPTYGYRRDTAVMNRGARLHGPPTIDAERVLRIMQHHGLTLERHAASRRSSCQGG